MEGRSGRLKVVTPATGTNDVILSAARAPTAPVREGPPPEKRVPPDGCDAALGSQAMSRFDAANFRSRVRMFIVNWADCSTFLIRAKLFKRFSLVALVAL